jgi:AcrR family transcriptional regulator
MDAALESASAWTDIAFIARHIAARASVTSQRFYKHYSGAEQLLAAAFERELGWLTNPEQAGAKANTAPTALRQWLDRLIHYISAKGGPKHALDEPPGREGSRSVRSRLAAALDQLLSDCATEHVQHPTRDASDVLYVVENIWHAADARNRYATAKHLVDALVDDLTSRVGAQRSQDAAARVLGVRSSTRPNGTWHDTLTVGLVREAPHDEPAQARTVDAWPRRPKPAESASDARDRCRLR